MPSLSFDLTGQVALVTGGTGGIGLAIAEALLDAGAKVTIGSRKMEKVEAAQKELSEGREDGSLLALQLDVSDSASIDNAVAKTVETFGKIDILINNAGSNLKKPSLELTTEDEKWLMDVNYFGPSYACRAFAKAVIEKGIPGSIVNVCSVTSFMALSEVTAYAATKGALLALTKQLAAEWPYKHNIRVNGIAPGFVPAEQNKKILESGDRGKRILSNTPMERFGTPEEIAGAVVYLCSPAGQFVNGECIKIDGGFMINGVSEALGQL